MKPSLRIVAAGIALIAASAGAGAPPENPAVRAPAPAAAPWLLAQERMPTCKVDNRNVPTGTTACRQKRLWVCERGDWVNTGKAC